MRIKSTIKEQLIGDELWNERQAHISMQQSKEQSIKDGIKARNAATIRSEQLRKERLNEALMHKVRQVLTLIAIAIVAYTLFHFA